MISLFSLAAACSVVAVSAGRGLRVIGAGYGRTGTDSLRLALNQLEGFGPTYHMLELLGFGERPVSPLEMLGLADGHNERWAEADHNISRGMQPNWAFLEQGFNSAVDAPASSFWPELLEANPSAKVVLTVRDPRAWHRSINGAFCRLVGGGSVLDRLVAAITSLRPYGRRNKRMHEAHESGTRRTLGAGWSDYSTLKVCGDQAYALAFFEAWALKVREAVPPGQLLVFETGKDGFEELARFLGVTAPAGAPYPHANSAAEFAFVINIQRALALATVLTVAVAVRFAVRCLPGQGGATRQKREKKEL